VKPDFMQHQIRSWETCSTCKNKDNSVFPMSQKTKCLSWQNVKTCTWSADVYRRVLLTLNCGCVHVTNKC